MNKKLQIFFAILAGIITMCLAGLILFPVLKWIIIKNLHLFEKSSALNGFVIYGSSFYLLLFPHFPAVLLLPLQYRREIFFIHL